jgi:hypothetical protein
MAKYKADREAETVIDKDIGPAAYFLFKRGDQARRSG